MAAFAHKGKTCLDAGQLTGLVGSRHMHPHREAKFQRTVAIIFIDCLEVRYGMWVHAVGSG